MDKKIKVLQFPIAASKGGITQYVLKNWKYIDKSRFQFDFATMSKELDFAAELEKEGCRVYYISCYAEENERRFIDEFREILRKGEYDIVHLHTKQWKSFNVEKLAREAGIKKIIVHSHSTGIDTIDEDKRKAEILLHDKMKNELTEDIATDFWACSQKAAEFLFGNKIPKERIKIMNNAIELEQFRYNKMVREKTRKEFGIEDKFVVGHIGRFAYQKNHEFLIEMFAELCRKEKNAVLLLAGDGELRDAMQKKVADLGIKDRVIFAGYRSDVNKLLQAMDIFCFPSYFEGLGISLIEAQAADLPCLCSEAIPKETKILKRFWRLRLDKGIWVEKIITSCGENAREGREKDMKECGYDIRVQIRNIEKEYRGEVSYRVMLTCIGVCA